MAIDLSSVDTGNDCGSQFDNGGMFSGDNLQLNSYGKFPIMPNRVLLVFVHMKPLS